MNELFEKKYLDDIISFDMKNEKNLKENTKKAIGIIKKITTTLSKRPYGKHNFKAVVVMRETMLLGSMLNNAESWINIIISLKKPDTLL